MNLRSESIRPREIKELLCPICCDGNQIPELDDVDNVTETGDIYIKDSPVYNNNGDLVAAHPITIHPKVFADKLNEVNNGESTLEEKGYYRIFCRIYNMIGVDLPRDLNLDVDSENYQNVSQDVEIRKMTEKRFNGEGEHVPK